jgi:EAL domain-containing protein (putative c-di-GMP-specific phosphodiesterase class I)
LRWTVDGELIPTARAISVAEESGMITRVSDWVLRVACRQFIRWRALHPEAAGWRLHVNVSARDIADERFVQRVLDGIALGGCEPDDLCLEITETAMVHHPERAQASLTELRNAGLVVAIDDFGTGYASLGVLRDVPADIVKIDRSFVSELSNSARDRKIVEHAIDLAHGLGLVVVAEGVETLAQMAILEELGCDQAQGFAFARPSPVEHLHLSI